MGEQADVIVVGMGPGGEYAAGRLADEGLDVVGIDRELVGGECPYWGCVPSKMMIRAGNLLAEARRISGMAGDANVRPDWSPVAKRIRTEATDSWDDRVAVERFEAKGGRFVRGHGRLTGRDSVEVDGTTFTARRGVIIATGTSAAIPPIPGLDDVGYWTNRQAIETEEVPESLVVIGGGAIGAELAQVFARFGSEVTVVEALARLLPHEEPEASEIVTDVFANEGIIVRAGVPITQVQRTGGGAEVRLEDGSTVEGTQLLVATGRRVDLKGINAAALDVDEDGRHLPVDERLQVVDGVWALGDVTGKGAFTHVAMYQAKLVVKHVLGQEAPPADYRALPRVTFTDPEVGSVGLTEDAARDEGLRVATGISAVPSSARGWIHKAGNEGVIKLVADMDAEVLVGATSAGPTGGEVLGLLTLAVHATVPIEQLTTMIYAYPTFHRGVEDAVDNLLNG